MFYIVFHDRVQTTNTKDNIPITLPEGQQESFRVDSELYQQGS